MVGAVRRMWQRLQWRLFASHLLVAMVAITVLCCAVELIATGYVVYGVGPHVRFWVVPVITSPQEAQDLGTPLTYALFVGGWGGLAAAMATTLFVSHRIV